jgi:uncharacterized SAM-dependent methyltransferase
VRFERDESIHTESSYKYDRETLAKLAGDTGFTLATTWTDSADLFSSNLLRTV